MNSRTPTAPEAWYGHLCTNFIGCIACRLDEREIIDPNESWVAFHHNSDIGSRKPGCHFHAMGLCHGHHQGMPGFNLPVRHQVEWLFKEMYGTDEYLCRENWKRVAELGKSRYHPTQGDVMQFCPWEDLRLDAGMPA